MSIPIFKHYIKLGCLITVFFISVLDYFIVIDLSLSILYLLPIALISWYGKRAFSILLVLISTLAWFVAEFSAKTDMYLMILL